MTRYRKEDGTCKNMSTLSSKYSSEIQPITQEICDVIIYRLQPYVQDGAKSSHSHISPRSY